MKIPLSIALLLTAPAAFAQSTAQKPVQPAPSLTTQTELKLRDYPALHVTARRGYLADQPATLP